MDVDGLIKLVIINTDIMSVELNDMQNFPFSRANISVQ
jgi:hypothetical protein